MVQQTLLSEADIPYFCNRLLIVTSLAIFQRPIAFFLLVVSLLAYSFAQAQSERMLIRIVSAGELRHSPDRPDVVKALGSPVFEHDGAYLYCDSAYLSEMNNNVDCFGHVRIKSSDTLNLYGKLLHYEGNSRIATLSQDVRLVDKQSTLTCNFMVYDRNTGVANYTTGGKIVSGDNTLTSTRCYYYTTLKYMYFRNDVVLTNPDYKIKCDTLKYNTLTRISNFLGPTIITGKDNYIYCEDGEYNRITSRSRFSKNALLVDENRRLTGDSLFYDDKIKYGKAIRHVVMTDTVQDVIVKGDFAEYFRNLQFTYVTGGALAMLGDDKDTLFLHADTLKATFDTAKNETRELMAYRNARFFRKDIQGASDSLYYSFADSVINLYDKPVLWSDKNQMTADTIRIFTGDQKVKELHLMNAAFIISRDSTESFNQVKGKLMKGYFKNNDLDFIDVLGNAETVYYVREDDKSLVGVNAAYGTRMRLLLQDNKVERILYFDKPKGNMLPEEKLQPEQKRMKGFEWRQAERPATSLDVMSNPARSANQ